MENWEQFYPTYSYKDKEILLKEYDLSSYNVQSQGKLFFFLTNLVLAVAAVVCSLLLGILKNDLKLPVFAELKILVPGLFVVLFFSWLTLKHFAYVQKSIIFDSRKIIVLRTMLGLNYGNLQLVLPNWRIEGATNPFVIRLFPGWFSILTFPFWIISTTSSFLIYFLVNNYLIETKVIKESIILTIIICLFLWFFILFQTYRKELYDTNENILLIIGKFISIFLRVKLFDNFEYLIYRAKLANYESKRLKIDINKIKPFLIFIEDRTFYKNKGVSLRGIIRALRDKIFIGKETGGSTITQQLARTLFIKDYHKKYRRKLLEFIFAFWLNSIINKDMILELHINSVRYDYKIIGVANAIRHYFGNPKKIVLSVGKAFFLAERISNIKSIIILNRLKALINTMFNEGIVNINDVKEIKNEYLEQAQNRKNIKILNNYEFYEFINHWNPSKPL